MAESELITVAFNPPKFGTFKRKPEEQTRDLTVANTFNKAVLFKMKTTRPKSFTMIPVFFCLQPNQTKSITLRYKGCKANVKPNFKDRFSVIMAVVPNDVPVDWNMQKIWKDKLELADSGKRKVLRILFEGHEEHALAE